MPELFNNLMNYQTSSNVTNILYDGETTSIKLPANLANAVLNFEFYDVDKSPVVNNIAGILTIVGKYGNGRPQPIGTIDLATANTYQISGVYDSLIVTLNNLSGCEYIIITAIQNINIINNSGTGTSGVTQISLGGINATGAINFAGAVTYTLSTNTFSFTGVGTGVTSISSADTTTMTITNPTTTPVIALTNQVTKQGNVFNGIDQLVKFGTDGNTPTPHPQYPTGDIGTLGQAELIIGTDIERGAINDLLATLSNSLTPVANDGGIVQNSRNEISINVDGVTTQIVDNKLVAIGGGSGTVTSVGFNVGTTGLTVSPATITTAGTFTLDGTLGLAHGGTGATTAINARTNLGLGNIATQNANSVAITGGTASLSTAQVSSAPANATDVANKAYVDSKAVGANYISANADATLLLSQIPVYSIVELTNTDTIAHTITLPNDYTFTTTSFGNTSNAISVPSNATVSISNTPTTGYVNILGSSKVASGGVSQDEFNLFVALTTLQTNALYNQSNLLIGLPFDLAYIQDWLSNASVAMRTIVITFASQTITFVATRADCNTLADFASFIQSRVIAAGYTTFTCICLYSDSSQSRGQLILTSNTSNPNTQILYPNVGAGLGFDEQIKITQNSGAILRINSIFNPNVTYIDSRSLGGSASLQTTATLQYTSSNGSIFYMPGCYITDNIGATLPLTAKLSNGSKANIQITFTIANLTSSVVTVTGLQFDISQLSSTYVSTIVTTLSNQTLTIPARSLQNYTLNFAQVTITTDVNNLLLTISGGSGIGGTGVNKIAFVNQFIVSLS